MYFLRYCNFSVSHDRCEQINMRLTYRQIGVYIMSSDYAFRIERGPKLIVIKLREFILIFYLINYNFYKL